jgi:hypothetical protein
MIAIATYATKSFLYAIEDQSALVLAAARYAQLNDNELTYILVTDDSQEGRDAAESVKDTLPFAVIHCPIDVDENTTGKHNSSGNITIAAMQHEAFHIARRIGAKFSKDLARRLKSKNKEVKEKADAELKTAPADGNIFARQAKGWRPRGWLEEAYPGVGCGAMLPTDWFGMGCTLFSQRALQLANWTGYQGAGTQDLWLGWRCLHQHGLRFAVVPHALASHLKPVDGKMTLMHAYHELDGLTKGHLRMSKIDQSPKEDTLQQ